MRFHETACTFSAVPCAGGHQSPMIHQCQSARASHGHHRQGGPVVQGTPKASWPKPSRNTTSRAHETLAGAHLCASRNRRRMGVPRSALIIRLMAEVDEVETDPTHAPPLISSAICRESGNRYSASRARGQLSWGAIASARP